MIRAVIQGRIGQTPRAATAEPPKPTDWFWPAIFLLLVAVEFMAGWSLDPVSFAALLAAFLVMHRPRNTPIKAAVSTSGSKTSQTRKAAPAQQAAKTTT